MWLTKKKVIVIALALLLTAEVVYAVTDNINITETINFARYVLTGDQKLLSNTLGFAQYTLTGDQKSLVNNFGLARYGLTGDIFYPDTIQNVQNPSNFYSIGFCANSTQLAFNNCPVSVEFTLIGAGTVVSIPLTSSCAISPSSVLGDGLPHSVSISPACTITATLTNGQFIITNPLYPTYGVLSLSSDGKTLVLQSCAGCTLSAPYQGVGSSGTATLTTIIYQTVVVNPQYNSCTDSASCFSNQLGAFTGGLLPTLFLIAIALYATHELDVNDERAYVFAFMMAISGSGFLSAIGAEGVYGIPWYIVIFVDIIGMLIIFTRKGNTI